MDIVRSLAEKGLLFSKEKHEHNYPHCWRCDSPLLYYANESWFIKTTALKEQLIQNNNEVAWHPEHIKNGRFGNFLEEMVDWNISRKRYWGTPLNIWQCESCNHQYAPKSIDELKKHSIQAIDEIELHKPYVDDIKLCCSQCGGLMTRTPEVIDVWFDSGSMPFAQYHFPFENIDLIEKQFPADVVIEGIDQTRGWFYSLLAVSTLFTGKAPYKRVLSLGHVLDENEQKMSKSKGNALDPMDLIHKFGADSLRSALLVDSAPWNPKRFSERVVQEAKSKLIDTFGNVHSFYTLYAKLDGFDANKNYDVKKNKLDEWILSRLNTTIKTASYYLEHYNFTNAAREIAKLIEEVSNWYVRRSRERFWSNGMNADKAAAYQTLYEVLTKTSQLLAPLTPFIAEDVHTSLAGRSVHLSSYPTHDDTVIHTQLEKEMAAVLQVVELGRSIRNTTSIKVKQPLASLSLMSSNQEMGWSSYQTIVLDKLNVKAFHEIEDEGEFATIKLKLDFKKSGAKFGIHANIANKWEQQLGNDEVGSFINNGYGLLTTDSGESVTITLGDVIVEKVAKAGFSSATNGEYTVILDIALTEELIQEGIAREFIRTVQEYRKRLNLPINMHVDIVVSTDDYLQSVIAKFDHMLKENLLLQTIVIQDKIVNGEEIKLGNHSAILQLIPKKDIY
ncbi:class I tRNA ligase family protein [Bacillus sp. JJ722]|uniref:class I tRNA ligase family protein n=1 Tax=Bacillus sp. JJ722 TaxID=3122973 RepID=UPI003F68B48C